MSCDAHQLGGKADGVDVAEHAVDLSVHQHLLAQVGLHVGDLDLVASNLASLQSAGNSFSAPSLAAPPSVLPSKSFGVLIGLSAFTATVNGGWLNIT